jgi:hypothetical protein
MGEWKKGDPVEITNTESDYYGQIGVVDDLGKKGGLWVKHTDGVTEYHPWGYKIVGQCSQLGGFDCPEGFQVVEFRKKAIRARLKLRRQTLSPRFRFSDIRHLKPFCPKSDDAKTIDVGEKVGV